MHWFPPAQGIGCSGRVGLGRLRNSPKLENPQPHGQNRPMPRPKRPPPGFPKEPRYQRQRTAAAAAAAPAGGGAGGAGDLLRAFGRCRALLDELLRHEDGWVFAAPVDARALGLRDYYAVVRDPMDLGTVLRRLERRRYADPLAFAADVRLTFSNAMSYNNRGDPVYESAAELSEIFEAGWAWILAELPPTPLPRDAERKRRITDQLRRLPDGVKRTVAGILKERGACLLEKNEALEVDLEKADAAMLDELDRLLTQHRAALVADVEALMQEP